MPDDTTTTLPTTTSTTTPLTAPLPEDFENTLPSPSGSICEQLTKAAQFDAVWVQFYNFMFKSDGSFTDEFKNMICAINCFTTGTTSTTTSGTGSTSSTTTTTIMSEIPHQVATSDSWRSACISSDGQKMAAATASKIWVSVDHGATWVAKTTFGVPGAGQNSLCCSDDFTILYACGADGNLYVSTDSGDTWTAKDSTRQWTVVCCSNDGVSAFAGNYGGSIYGSTDTGNTWAVIYSHGAIKYVGMACSADRTTVIFSSYDVLDTTFKGRVFRSVDSLSTIASSVLLSAFQVSVATDSDGGIYFSGENGGLLYGGSTTPGSGDDFAAEYVAISCSGDGQKLVVGQNGKIVISDNAGSTLPVIDSVVRSYSCSATSRDGTNRLIGVNPGFLYLIY